MSMAEQSLELDVHEGEGEAADGVSGQATPKSWQEELEEHGETGGERRHGTEDGDAPPCAGGEIAADKGGGEGSESQDENHAGVVAVGTPLLLSGDAVLDQGSSPGAESAKPRRELKAQNSHPEAPPKKDRKTGDDTENALSTEGPTDVGATGQTAEHFELPSRANGERSKVRQRHVEPGGSHPGAPKVKSQHILARSLSLGRAAAERAQGWLNRSAARRSSSDGKLAHEMVAADAGVSHDRRLLLSGARPLRSDRGCRLAALQKQTQQDATTEAAQQPKRDIEAQIKDLLAKEDYAGAAAPQKKAWLDAPIETEQRSKSGVEAPA